jgi:hypothetical protein
MSLTAEIELAIRKAIAEKIANVADAGYVIPAPLYFADRADFFATVNPLVTQKLIETTPVAFCCLSLLKFGDSRAEGCADEPLVRLTYNLYFFREYGFERADESLTPDEFLKKNLKSYNAFIKAILDARIEFLGLQYLVSAELPENFDVKSNSLVQEDEFIEENDKCRYVPKVKGHSVDMQATIQVLINEI